MDGALSVAGVESLATLAVHVDNKRIELPLRRLHLRIPALRVTADTVDAANPFLNPVFSTTALILKTGA
jgi:hypothetical protein